MKVVTYEVSGVVENTQRKEDLCGFHAGNTDVAGRDMLEVTEQRVHVPSLQTPGKAILISKTKDGNEKLYAFWLF